MSASPKPIFLDDTGRRWKASKRLAMGLILLISIVGAVVAFSIFFAPMDPLATRFQLPKLETHEQAARRFLAQIEKKHLGQQIAEEQVRRRKQRPRTSGDPYSNAIVAGFYVNWDDRSLQSFAANKDFLTCVMPEWLTLTADGLHYDNRRNNDTDPQMEKLARDPNDPQHPVAIYLMLDNVKTGGTFDWPRLKSILSADDDTQKQLAEDIVDYINDRKYDGINIDFEPEYGDIQGKQLAAAHKLVYQGVPRFIRNLKSVIASRGRPLVVSEDLPADNPDFDYTTISELTDFVVLMMYDQHPAGGDPGPIASQQWIEQIAEKAFSRMDSRKVVLGLENRYYDWPVKWNSDDTYTAARPATADDIITGLGLARDSGAKIEMDDDDLNPYFTYANSKDQQDHLVYMLDAVTAYNQITALAGYQPAGAALWFLGSEDPSIWQFFNKDKLGDRLTPDDLKFVDCTATQPDGEGDISQIEGDPRRGKRTLTQDKDGLFDSEEYSQYPSPYVKHKFGDEKLKDVALTFDDGPSEWTTKVLDILGKNNVPAAFFVIGTNADHWQDMVKREFDQGYEIGNHTYYHPDLADSSVLRAELEVNATQRVIESITGHSTRLFRPPLGTDEETPNLTPEQKQRVQDIMIRMNDLGYLAVGFSIDPKDYGEDGQPPQPPPPPGVIIKRVLGDLPDVSSVPNGALEEKLPPAQQPKGHIILLHDGGGDRGHTVQALQAIIDGVRKRGYRFVSISDLCKGKVNSPLFPPVIGDRRALAGVDSVVFETQYGVLTLLRILFFIAIVLGVLRVIVVALLAVMQARRARAVPDDGFTPPVTVIVPGFNEEKVICRTVENILASDYPDLRVIAVDDGSTDDTELVLRRQFSDDPRVTIIRKENGGKAIALNMALERVETDIVVCIDADTVVAPDAVRKLARHFADPTVGAVAGNIKVGNRTNPLAIWQSLEYISSQNFDRRAYALFSSVPVVPGALGAWRVSAITQAGGYCPSTLAEDTDLTFRVRLLGYRTISENEALAFTEAPDNVRALFKQRFRWAFGILQALCKHRDVLGRARAGAMGLFVMPSMWVYNVFFQAIAPVVDLAVIASLLQGQARMVLSYWAALFVLDFLASMVAFDLDREDPKALVWLFWQRFFYRQFMYYVIWKSLLAAVRGHSVGWGKLQRKASVTAR